MGHNEIDSIKKFCEDFFKNLNSDIIWDNDILFVQNVPQEFEDFFRKRSPYFLAFSPPDVKNSDYELMTKGSLLLKAMSGFLKERGQMTLLTTEFTIDPMLEIQKRFIIKGYDIESIKLTNNYDYIFRFTFLTNFQYLNEKDQLTNTIYIHDKGIIDNFNLDDYITIEGKKEDIKLKDIKEEFNISKEILKTLIENKKNEITLVLNKSLDESIERIKSQYLEKIYEIDDESNKNIDRIKDHEEKLLKTNSDIKKLNEKIDRLKENIKKIDQSFEKKVLEQEKEFYITEEKHKHSLNITNSLINSTIFYYPIYNFKLYLKKLRIKYKPVEITYNPLTKKVQPLHCISCNIEIKQIILCHDSHLTCENCFKKCNICGGDTCKSCGNLNCVVCKRNICRSCGKKCFICDGLVCKSDHVKDPLTNKDLCTNCAKQCTICNNYSEKKLFLRCTICSTEVCPKCATRTISKTTKGFRIICHKCQKRTLTSYF